MSELADIQRIVTAAAREELLPRFARVERGRKADGSVITEADLVVQQRVGEALGALRGDCAFLGEEMTAEEQEGLLGSGRPVWCLDPLDGTSNFANGIPYYCISLALIEDGQPRLGIVYDPTRDECFSAERGLGAMLNGERLEARASGLTLKQTSAMIDFKRLPRELSVRLVAEIPYASQRSFGSVALDWCWLAAGRSHIYLHGRQNIWDYAAGNLIYHESGGRSVTLDGEPVFVNALTPRSAIAALDPELFVQWCEWLGIEERTA